jgi:hypothetical protein
MALHDRRLARVVTEGRRPNAKVGADLGVDLGVGAQEEGGARVTKLWRWILVVTLLAAAILVAGIIGAGSRNWPHQRRGPAPGPIIDTLRMYYARYHEYPQNLGEARFEEMKGSAMTVEPVSKCPGYYELRFLSGLGKGIPAYIRYTHTGPTTPPRVDEAYCEPDTGKCFVPEDAQTGE